MGWISKTPNSPQPPRLYDSYADVIMTSFTAATYAPLTPTPPFAVINPDICRSKDPNTVKVSYRLSRLFHLCVAGVVYPHRPTNHINNAKASNNCLVQPGLNTAS
jgi:hypothetical protein